MYDCSQTTALVEVPTVQVFLLVQDGNILSVNFAPHKLNFDALNEWRDFQIYAGAKNEFGKKEIVGPIARVWLANEFSKYVLGVKYKDYQSSVNFDAVALPSEILQRELQRLFWPGKFLNPSNLAEVCLFAS